jgi:hypothetical protein
MSHDRIHRALDGELPLDQLDPAEASVYHQYRQAITSAVRPLSGLPEIDVAPRILGALVAGAGTRPARHRRRPPRFAAAVLAAAWTPRSFTLRPALAAAAVVLAVFGWVTHIAGRAEGDSVGRPLMVVEFRLAAPGAGSVSLVGDFNAWRPEHQLREVSPGLWAVRVALEPGAYSYGFMVDGSSIRLDPLAPRAADGFGGESSRVTVLPPMARS